MVEQRPSLEIAQCGHWSDGVECGQAPTRRYLAGHRCAAHTPAALAGRLDLEPDPERTLDALREKAGRIWTYSENDSALINERAIASGRRRSNAHDYKAARAAEDARKAARR